MSNNKKQYNLIGSHAAATKVVWGGGLGFARRRLWSLTAVCVFCSAAAGSVWWMPRRPRASWIEEIARYEVHPFFLEHQVPLQFSPDGRYVLTQWREPAFLRDAKTGRPRVALFDGYEEEAKRDDWIIHQHFFTNDGTRFVAVLGPNSSHGGIRRQLVRIWDLTDGRERLIRTISWRGSMTSSDEWLTISDDLSTIAFPADPKAGASKEAKLNAIQVVDVRDGLQHRLVPGLPPCALSHDGRFCAVLDTVEDRRPLIVFYQVDGERIAEFTYVDFGGVEIPRRLRLSEDNRKAAIEFSEKAIIFQVLTGRALSALPIWSTNKFYENDNERGLPWFGPNYELCPYAFPEGTHDAAVQPVWLASDAKWDVWKTRVSTPDLSRTVEYLAVNRGPGVHSPYHDPSQEAATVIDLPSNKVVARFPDPNLWSVSISPDGKAVGMLTWERRTSLNVYELIQFAFDRVRGNAARQTFRWKAWTKIVRLVDGKVLGFVPFPEDLDRHHVQSALGPEGKTLVQRYFMLNEPNASFNTLSPARVEVWDVPPRVSLDQAILIGFAASLPILVLRWRSKVGRKRIQESIV